MLKSVAKIRRNIDISLLLKLFNSQNQQQGQQWWSEPGRRFEQQRRPGRRRLSASLALR